MRPAIGLGLAVLCCSFLSRPAAATGDYADKFPFSDQSAAVLHPQVSTIQFAPISTRAANLLATFSGELQFTPGVASTSSHLATKCEFHVPIARVTSKGGSWVSTLPQVPPVNPVILFMQGAGAAAVAGFLPGSSISVEESWVDMESVAMPRPHDELMLHVRVAVRGMELDRVSFIATVSGRSFGGLRP